jgi:hypothetical protein
MRDEIATTMRLLGVTRLDQLGPHLVSPSEPCISIPHIPRPTLILLPPFFRPDPVLLCLWAKDEVQSPVEILSRSAKID